MAGLGFYQIPEDMDVQSLPPHWSGSCWLCPVGRGGSEVERGVLIQLRFPGEKEMMKEGQHVFIIIQSVLGALTGVNGSPGRGKVEVRWPSLGLGFSRRPG